MTTCSICGGSHFVSQRVLWPQLIAEWQLSQEEAAYVDEQQGRSCQSCGANLRVIALGNAVQTALGTHLSIQAYATASVAKEIRILDVNGAVAISPALSALPGYVRADFPAVDMRALPYGNGTFHIVLHSDTLEHVENPIRALEECGRVLRPGGRLCFTIPVIVGRLTRSRAGLPNSYHGQPLKEAADFVVHTEFGADAWTFVMKAGFTHVTVNQVEYPAAIALCAWRDERPVLLKGAQ